MPTVVLMYHPCAKVGIMGLGIEGDEMLTDQGEPGKCSEGRSSGAKSALRPISVVAVAAMLLLAGCGDDPGNADEPTSGGPSPLDSVVACDLLSAEDAATLGPDLESEEQPEDGASSGCGWNTSLDSKSPIEESVSLGIRVRPHQGLSSLRSKAGGEESSTTVGDREAKQISEGGGEACILGIAVGDGRVEIIMVGERSCAKATDVAQIIEPKLPQV